MVYKIYGNTPSSKNARIISTKNNAVLSLPSQAAQRWWRETKDDFTTQQLLFIHELSNYQPPYYIQFTFFKLTRARFDYHNAIQIVADAMRFYHWIEDDNMKVMKCYFGDAEHDKDNPRVEIEILPEKPKHKLPVNKILSLIVASRDAYRESNSVLGEDLLKLVYDTIKNSE